MAIDNLQKLVKAVNESPEMVYLRTVVNENLEKIKELNKDIKEDIVDSKEFQEAQKKLIDAYDKVSKDTKEKIDTVLKDINLKISYIKVDAQKRAAYLERVYAKERDKANTAIKKDVKEFADNVALSYADMSKTYEQTKLETKVLVEEKLNQLGELVGEKLNVAAKFIGEKVYKTFSATLNFIQDKLKLISTSLSSLIGTVKAGFSKLKDFILRPIDWIKSLPTKILNGVVWVFGKIKNFIIGTIKLAYKVVVGTIKYALIGVVKLVKGALWLVGKIVQGLYWVVQKAFALVFKLVSKVLSFVVGVLWASIKAVGKFLLSFVFESLKLIGKTVIKIGAFIFKTAIQIIGTMLSSALGPVILLLGGILLIMLIASGKIKGLWDSVLNFFGFGKDGKMDESKANQRGTFSFWLSEKWREFTDWIGKVFSGAGEIGEKFYSWLENIFIGIGGFFSKVFDKTTSIGSKFWNILKNIGNWIIDNILGRTREDVYSELDKTRGLGGSVVGSEATKEAEQLELIAKTAYDLNDQEIETIYSRIIAIRESENPDQKQINELEAQARKLEDKRSKLYEQLIKAQDDKRQAWEDAGKKQDELRQLLKDNENNNRNRIGGLVNNLLDSWFPEHKRKTFGEILSHYIVGNYAWNWDTHLGLYGQVKDFLIFDVFNPLKLNTVSIIKVILEGLSSFSSTIIDFIALSLRPVISYISEDFIPDFDKAVGSSKIAIATPSQMARDYQSSTKININYDELARAIELKRQKDAGVKLSEEQEKFIQQRSNEIEFDITGARRTSIMGLTAEQEREKVLSESKQQRQSLQNGPLAEMLDNLFIARIGQAMYSDANFRGAKIQKAKDYAYNKYFVKYGIDPQYGKDTYNFYTSPYQNPDNILGSIWSFQSIDYEKQLLKEHKNVLDEEDYNTLYNTLEKTQIMSDVIRWNYDQQVAYVDDGWFKDTPVSGYQATRESLKNEPDGWWTKFMRSPWFAGATAALAAAGYIALVAATGGLALAALPAVLAATGSAAVAGYKAGNIITAGAVSAKIGSDISDYVSSEPSALFAMGGIIKPPSSMASQGRVITVAEAGDPEIVVPLNQQGIDYIKQITTSIEPIESKRQEDINGELIEALKSITSSNNKANPSRDFAMPAMSVRDSDKLDVARLISLGILSK
jgi:hypothetical protein